MSIPTATSSDIGSTSQPIPNVPKVSFTSISSLTDLLRDLPFVRPIDTNLIDFDIDANDDDETDKLKLIDNKAQFERSVQLLNSTESSLVESLSKLLLQVDTNKINFKHKENKSVYFSPLLVSILDKDPTVFNSVLGEKYQEYKQVNVKQPEPVVEQNEYKVISDPTKLCVKLTRVETPLKTEPKKEIKTTSFYSTKPEVKPSLPSPVQKQKRPGVDLKSSLTLPDDFTPELIQQLAAEGCDLLGGRKSRKPEPVKKLLDSSSDSEDEFKFKKKIDKEYQQKVTGTPSKSTTTTPIRVNLNQRKKDLSGLDPIEHPSYKRFTQLLDDLLDSYEHDLQQMSLKKNDQDEDIPSEYLLPRQVCAELVQEAFKLNSYSIMSLIKKESLSKLQNLLFYNIKDGIRSLHLMNEDQNEDKILKDILIDKLLRASDCCIISLIIMTSPKIPKELIVEDIIEQIVLFIKVNLNETIFPSYDPVYNKPTDSKSKRKLFGQTPNQKSTASKHTHHIYNRMREMLNLTSDLVSQVDLTDTIVITLTSLGVMCFFVENINDLQLETLKILTNIFTRYDKHRQLVLDDVLSSLSKLHSNKKSSKSYKCFNGDSIQMFTALILQLIQSEVGTQDEQSYDENENYLLTTFEQSNERAKKFLSIFFTKCKCKQSDFDYRPLFENFIQDLLVTVNKPEWPVSEIILNLLGLILVNQIQNEQSDVQSRVNSLEYLGQIVSQLRKDSLEYQKNPERVEKILKTFDQNDLIFESQKSLISYLNSLITNDQMIEFSKKFQISQWLRELTQTNLDKLEHGDQRVDQHDANLSIRKRVYDLIHQKDTESKLDQSEAFLLSKYLTSLKKTLDKNFDFYLINIVNLTGSDSNTPTQVRSKAIKSLSLIIEADPQILLKQKVFQCVEANFLHATISVREASVDLIGRFITIMPELTQHYYKLLSDRILDVGVSVRKRVIKIFRDICLNQPDFEYLTEICVKILRRINDEENIRKLVIETFYSLWFGPCDSKDLWLKRVMNLVDVVSEFNVITNVTGMEFFEILFSSLIYKESQVKEETKDVDSLNEKEILINRSREVEKSCKKIVDCLIENVLRTEANTSNNSSVEYKRLVSSFSTLYLLSKIKPDYFITHAETLLPYLNIKSTNPNDTQIINSAAKILECVVPLLQSPSNSFLLSLEESLCKLIFQSGMMIVSSCISCLGTVVNKLTKNYKLAADCLFKFFTNTNLFKRNIDPSKMDSKTKPMLYRVLFTLGLLSKHFDVESDEFKEFKICTKNDLFEIFLYFIKKFDQDVQLKALIGLGYFLTRNSEYMMKDEVKSLYLGYIKSENNFNLKAQVFANLTDYLNEEDQRNLVKSVELAKSHIKDDLKEMLDVQSGMASTIIQSFLKPILESYLTPNPQVRLSVFNCLSMILTQGLVYPIDCVPYLIAMTTDTEKKILTKSLTHLTNLQKAHPNFVQSKSIAGINISFLLQKITCQSAVIRGYTDNNEVLSLNHHLYTLLRSNRSYRRAFIQQLLKMFDDSARNKTSLAHMLFITDNLAYFPYQLLDEPLYIIHQIDLIISCTGINLLQTFKENLKNSQRVGKKVFINEVKGDLEEFSQLECPQEEFDSNLNKRNHIEDDDDETFESVYQNLPDDLTQLKDCMYKAQGCCLLLILKMFLKEVYTISDGKIQNYAPTDTAKVNDRPLTSRKTNRKFNPKQIIDYIQRVKEVDRETLVNEYLEFKQLIMSIDQEESEKTNDQKISQLQLKLSEGIEKTRPGDSSVQATPVKSRLKHKRNLSSSNKKSSSKKKRKKIRDSDESSDESFDTDDD